jgi:hypothetical protein
VGPGPRRSIRLRRLPDDPGTTKEYLRLLVAVLVLFALQASMGETDLAVILQLFVAGSALILALRIADAHARVQRYIGLLCFVALGAAILQAWEGDNVSVSGSLLLINGLLVATGPIVLFQAVRRHPDVSVRTLIATLTIYVLIGLFFAFLYRAFVQFNSDSFTSATDLDPAAMQYFSFITMTTVGFGDITPVSDVARTVVALEALIGQVYLVTVVALVVANIGAERIAARTRREREQDDE